jgi:antirestriction protein ArdC
MPTQSDIRSDITTKIIQALESGVVPWRRPWTVSPNTGRPTSVSTGKPYSGVNPLLLELHRLQHGFQSKYWATFRQWEALGGMVKARPSNVKPGEWGCHIIYYSPISKTVTDPATGDEKEDRFFLLKSYVVFCADQVSGEKIDRFKVIDEPGTGVALPDFEPAEKLIAACGVTINYGGDRAYYTRPQPEGSWPHHTSGDTVTLIFQRSEPAGISGCRAARCRNWLPRSARAICRRNWASRTAKGWRITSPTSSLGYRR